MEIYMPKVDDAIDAENRELVFRSKRSFDIK